MKKQKQMYKLKGWPEGNPSAFFYVADDNNLRTFDNKNKAQNSCDSFNRRFNKANFRFVFEVVEHGK